MAGVFTPRRLFMGIDAPQWLLPAYLRSVKAVGGTASVEAIR